MSNKPTKDQIRAKKKREAQKAQLTRMHSANKQSKEILDWPNLLDQMANRELVTKDEVYRRAARFFKSPPDNSNPLSQYVVDSVLIKRIKSILSVFSDISYAKSDSYSVKPFERSNFIFFLNEHEGDQAVSFAPLNIIIASKWNIQEFLTKVPNIYYGDNYTHVVYFYPHLNPGLTISFAIVASIGAEHDYQVYLIDGESWIPVSRDRWLMTVFESDIDLILSSLKSDEGPDPLFELFILKISKAGIIEKFKQYDEGVLNVDLESLTKEKDQILSDAWDEINRTTAALVVDYFELISTQKKSSKMDTAQVYYEQEIKIIQANEKIAQLRNELEQSRARYTALSKSKSHSGASSNQHKPAKIETLEHRMSKLFTPPTFQRSDGGA